MTRRRNAVGTVAVPVAPDAPWSMHAGLWMDRYLDQRDRRDGAKKAQHIAALGRISVPDGYVEAGERRTAALLGVGGRGCDVVVPRKMVPGLGFRGVLEAGLSLEHTWGTPVVTGSSLKGAARAHCAQLEDARWAPTGGEYFRALFGTTDSAGAVCFHDAWWVPDGRTTLPIYCDVMTPHYGSYYGTGDASRRHSGEMPPPHSPAGTEAVPDGMDDPVPLSFAVVAKARFRILLTGDGDWCAAAETILLHALSRNGVGAKGDSGYGRMTLAG